MDAIETKAGLGRDMDELMQAFEAFKETNDRRLAEIERRGSEDAVTADKLARIEKTMDAISLKQARVPLGETGAQKPAAELAHKSAFDGYVRKGETANLTALEQKALSVGTDTDGGYLVPKETEKAHLRLETSADDALVTSLLITSRLHIEAALGLALTSQEWTLVLDAWPATGVVNIPMRPVSAVSAVRVRKADGSPVVVDPGTYIFEGAGIPPRLVPEAGAWTNPERAIAGIEIDFTAGFGAAAASVPEPVRQALKLWVSSSARRTMRCICLAAISRTR